MNNIAISKIERLNFLNEQIKGAVKTTLESAIEAGEILTGIKDTLKHGTFTKWIEENCQFTDRTARSYMRVYQNRERLKTESVSDLSDAYKLLEEPKEQKELKLIPFKIPNYPDAILTYYRDDKTSEVHLIEIAGIENNEGYVSILRSIENDCGDAHIEGIRRGVLADIGINIILTEWYNEKWRDWKWYVIEKSILYSLDIPMNAWEMRLKALKNDTGKEATA